MSAIYVNASDGTAGTRPRKYCLTSIAKQWPKFPSQGQRSVPKIEIIIQDYRTLVRRTLISVHPLPPIKPMVVRLRLNIHHHRPTLRDDPTPTGPPLLHCLFWKQNPKMKCQQWRTPQHQRSSNIRLHLLPCRSRLRRLCLLQMPSPTP